MQGKYEQSISSRCLQLEIMEPIQSKISCKQITLSLFQAILLGPYLFSTIKALQTSTA